MNMTFLCLGQMQANHQKHSGTKIPQVVLFLQSVHPFLTPGLCQQWWLHPLLLDSYYTGSGILSTSSQRGLTIPFLSNSVRQLHQTGALKKFQSGVVYPCLDIVKDQV